MLILSLSNAIVQLSRELTFDLVHAHYAIPHATAAYLARQILSSTSGAHVPKIITTLHGTDITLLGSDRSHSRRPWRFQSIGRTVSRRCLRAQRDTYRALEVQRDIRVIPNFVDTHRYRRVSSPDLRRQICPSGRYEKLIVHTSNFRPVKREAVVDIFRRIRAVAVSLVLVGDGPDLPKVSRLAHDLGGVRMSASSANRIGGFRCSRSQTCFFFRHSRKASGSQHSRRWPAKFRVVASRVGGLPEVIDDGVDGYLRDPDDLQGMAEQALKVLEDSNCTSVLPPRRDARSNRSSAPIALCLKMRPFIARCWCKLTIEWHALPSS